MGKQNSVNIFTNLIWRFLERCGASGVTFIVYIVLARLLNPEAYGTISLVTVLISILQVFIDSGFGTALIQKKNADEVDFSSVFYFNVATCIVIYVLMYVSAPFISAFYNIPELTSITRVLSIVILISGIKGIQQSYVSKYLMFKKSFYSSLSGTIGAAVVGIVMAHKGFGVWALVAQQILNTFLSTVILWFTVKWRPKLCFSLKRLKNLFSFGWKLLASGLIDTAYLNLRQLVIGKLYTPSDLAYYNKGNQFPQLIVENINSSINSVLFPTMAVAQDNRENLKAMTRRAIKISTYVMMPMMIGLAICSKILVPLLLTDKWSPCIEYIAIFCFTYSFHPIHTSNLNVIKAMGRSDIFLKLEVIKKVIGIAILIFSMSISVKAMAYSLLLTTILNSFINAFPNKKLLNYGYIDQIVDILPQISLSVVMGLIIYPISFIGIHPILILMLQVITGCLIYIGGSCLFKYESYYYFISIIKNMLKFKNKKNAGN